MLNKFNLKSKKVIIAGSAVLAVLLLCIIVAVSVSAKHAAKKEVKTYDYNETEQAIADAVKAYLAQYIELPEQTANEIADGAVQNYNTVIASDTDVINDEITDAVRKRIRSTIVALAEHSERLSEDTLDALASGVTEIIWKAVLAQLAQNELTSADEKRREEYEYLMQSLQEQINALKERKSKISIRANITDNREAEITGEALLAGIEDLNSEELSMLAEKMGMSVSQLMELLESSIDKSNADMMENFNKVLEKELAQLRRELQSGTSSASGAEGAAGKTGEKGERGEKGEKGEDGKAGVQGAAGEDGADGKTTYIAYADDAFGTNFSLTPTETSKYVGTCITSDTQQPSDYAMYGNWQEYRTYIITSTTDPDTGVTTVHIN